LESHVSSRMVWLGWIEVCKERLSHPLRYIISPLYIGYISQGTWKIKMRNDFCGRTPWKWEMIFVEELLKIAIVCLFNNKDAQ
jgi:hypothetical protein